MSLTHSQVLDGLDDFGGRAMRGVISDYRAGVLGPLVDAIKGSRDIVSLRRAIGPKLLKRMKTKPVEEGLAAAMTQAALIGRVSATPARKR